MEVMHLSVQDLQLLSDAVVGNVDKTVVDFVHRKATMEEKKQEKLHLAILC